MEEVEGWRESWVDEVVEWKLDEEDWHGLSVHRGVCVRWKSGYQSEVLVVILGTSEGVFDAQGGRRSMVEGFTWSCLALNPAEKWMETRGWNKYLRSRKLEIRCRASYQQLFSIGAVLGSSE
ncbi:unnamed protein product [Vicia faba]|uniref:Uncharacterized protein n=1 Tax=Vicia faba TaxID=3906 RepID=A0AAV0YKB5_VICFA|nr:unnamed protein product [Vicia faba]